MDSEVVSWLCPTGFAELFAGIAKDLGFARTERSLHQYSVYFAHRDTPEGTTTFAIDLREKAIFDGLKMIWDHMKARAEYETRRRPEVKGAQRNPK